MSGVQIGMITEHIFLVGHHFCPQLCLTAHEGDIGQQIDPAGNQYEENHTKEDGFDSISPESGDDPGVEKPVGTAGRFFQGQAVLPVSAVQCEEKITARPAPA